MPCTANSPTPPGVAVAVKAHDVSLVTVRDEAPWGPISWSERYFPPAV